MSSIEARTELPAAAPAREACGSLDDALEITWCATSDSIPEALWHDCFRAPRIGLFWFRSLEHAKLSDQFTFLFGLLKLNGIPVGIVPAFVFDLPLDLVMPDAIARVVSPIARGPLRGLAFQRTFFIGGVGIEEGHVGIVHGHSLRPFVDFIHRAAREKARRLRAAMLVWKEFPASDRGALDELVASGRAFSTVSYPGTVIPLMPGGYRAFLATLRSDRRWKINNKLRRGAATIGVTSSVIRRPDPAEIAELFALFWQTYLRGATKFERLTPEFFSRIAACDESTFLIQRDTRTGKMVAFMLLLDLGERVVNQFIGIDYEAGTGGYLYFRLFAEAYDWACSTGATVMHSGQTAYTGKLDLGHTLVPLWNFCEHGNWLINHVYRVVGKRIRWETLDAQLCEYLSAHPEAADAR